MRAVSLQSFALAFGAFTLMGCSGTISPNDSGDMPGDAGTGGTSSGVGGSASSKGVGGAAGATGKAGAGTGGSGTGGSVSPGTGGAGAVGGTGGKPAVVLGVALDGQPVYAHWVRLTHAQWEASVRDLLKLSATPGLASAFEGDPPNGFFSNNERALEVTNNLWADYQRAAETLAKQVAQDATARARIAPGTDSAGFISTFGRRAYRRDLTPGEKSKYQALFDSAATAYDTTDPFANGVELVITAMLQSPHFVYRSELGEDGAPLSGFEIASKLSFLLRNTTPADELLDAAAAGQLDTSAGVVSAAERMLEDPAALEVARRFHSELFGLQRYELIEKNRTLFPDFTDAVKPDIIQADVLFFDRIFSQNQGFREILTSTVGFINAATAPFYDRTATGSGFQEVDLGEERPGFMTRVGFLAYNGTLRDPDPIHRGVDVINRLLCADMIPPADLEILPLPDPVPGQTNRERVTAHTGQGVCAGCHVATINPIGFAFENFDAMGQLRTTDANKPVDTSGEYEWPEGPKSFSGAKEFLAQMAESGQPHACFSMHLAEYALARDIGSADAALVTKIQEISLRQQSSEKEAILAVVQDPSFTVRAGAL
jgi:hypothetical protein